MELVKSGCDLKRSEKQNKGTIGQAKPQISWGSKGPAQRPLRPGPPCTSEPVYTQQVHYNHLLQEKQALLFEIPAKKKPLVRLSCREEDIQIMSLPQLQNPTTQVTTKQMEDGKRQTWGRKNVWFSLHTTKGLKKAIFIFLSFQHKRSIIINKRYHHK